MYFNLEIPLFRKLIIIHFHFKFILPRIICCPPVHIIFLFGITKQYTLKILHQLKTIPKFLQRKNAFSSIFISSIKTLRIL